MATETVVEVVMPQMGVSVSEGTVTRWLRNVGDTIVADEPLLEVSTDKVDTEVPSPRSGVLLEILVAEGETVGVGVVLARIGGPAGSPVPPPDEARPAPQQPPLLIAAPEPAAWPTPETPIPPAAPLLPTPEPQPVPQPVAASPPAMPTIGNGPAHMFISPVVARIAAEHGIDPTSIEGSGRAGRVTKKDLLAYVEAASPAPADALPPPAPATTGPTAATPVVEAPPSPPPSVPTPPTSTPPVAPPPSVPTPPTSTPPVAPPPSVPTPPASTPPVAPPPAAAAAPAAPPPAPPAAPASSRDPRADETLGPGEQLEPMSIMRRGIAEHMRRSLDTAAHVTSAIEVDMTRVAAIRERIKEEFTSSYGVNPTYLAFIARATVDTLMDWPWVNAELRGDAILTRRNVNLGIAVALEGGKGLIVPVLRNAEGLNLLGMARGIADLAERARTRKLLPDDVQGGTFTITNPGGYGTLLGTPIISQPQSAILGTYAIVRRPWVITDDGGQEAIAIRSIMNLTLTYDHRIVDGAYGAQFLRDLAARLQSWGESDY